MNLPKKLFRNLNQHYPNNIMDDPNGFNRKAHNNPAEAVAHFMNWPRKPLPKGTGKAMGMKQGKTSSKVGHRMGKGHSKKSPLDW